MSSDSSYSDDDYEVREDGKIVSASAHRNQQPQKTSAKGNASVSHVDNMSHHICDDMMTSRKGGQQQDKADRATVENVMDPRTRMILYKLVRNGVLEAVHGCVSTGKEANVYYATGAGKEYAIKVYRTSVLIFKDRERYVEGDFRFQRYCKSNPRKMVRVWAEKEARNLRRLETAGIPSPKMLQLRHHVLLMSFLGHDGWPMPRLHDCPEYVRSHGPRLYESIVNILRTMYTQCSLVHGDFSEYNLLVDVRVKEDEQLPQIYVIDVSQSVEPDHPNSSAFLRRDILNVIRFFQDYVSPEDLASLEDSYAYIIGRSPTLTRGGKGSLENVDPLRDAVFEHIPIPQSLEGYTVTHVSADVERQYQVLKETKSKTHPADTGASPPTKGKGNTGQQKKTPIKEDSDSSSSEDSSDEEGEEGEEGEETAERKAKAVPLTKEEKKQHRKEIKEANREKRKTKVPKHLKKKKCGKK
eukprot:PhF_6_TR4830/c0_g1_i1/m.6711/K07178/RIOK1; RIO kinase 1